jgi:3-hydroxybutyryl-CoA dehydratase
MVVMASDNNPAATVIHYLDIHAGFETSHRYVVNESVYQSFLAAFGDYSPIHVDAQYATSKGFEDRVMHGTILNGFLSHFVGMIFPGRLSLLLSVDIRFAKPVFLNDELELSVKVLHKVDAAQVLELGFKFDNQTRHQLAARGTLQVKVLNQ